MRSADRRVSITAPPVVTEKSHEVLSRYLRNQILSGAIAAGSLLPPERQFAEQTGFGRSTVREAIRVLVADGLVTVRSGTDRGVEVIAPSTQPMRRAVESYVHGNGLSMATLIDARAALEPQGAALGARFRDEAALARLDEALAAIAAAEADADYLMHNTRWHVEVARSGGNALIASMVEALIHTTVASRSTSWYTRSAEVRAEALRSHTAVVAAIRDQDPDAAAAELADQLAQYRAMAGELGLLDRPIPYEPDFVRGITPI